MSMRKVLGVQNCALSIELEHLVDTSLNSFHNSIIAFLVSKKHGNTRIMGMTKKKSEDDAMSTDWLHMPSGSYTLLLKFCRPLKIIEPEKSDEIVDAHGKLTKSFK